MKRRDRAAPQARALSMMVSGSAISPRSATAGDIDLACWFTGDAATRAAAEDGEEAPPPNDYYVRNLNETLRTVVVSPGAEVIWFPDFGDPTSEGTTSYENWIVEIQERDFMPGVWLTIEDKRW